MQQGGFMKSSICSILEKRREKISKELEVYGCFGEMPKIRPYQDGANEILRIIAVNKNYMPYYLEVSFEYLKPFSGERGIWHIRFNTGMIIIPVIDGQILLKREHRPTIGRWTWELPRVFVNLLLEKGKADNSSLVIISQILKSEVDSFFVDKPSIVKTCLVHEGVAENTGTNAVVCPVFFVEIKGKIKDDNQKKKIIWKLFPYEEAKGTVFDVHSMAAFFSLERKIKNGNISLT